MQQSAIRLAKTKSCGAIYALINKVGSIHPANLIAQADHEQWSDFGSANVAFFALKWTTICLTRSKSKMNPFV